MQMQLKIFQHGLLIILIIIINTRDNYSEMQKQPQENTKCVLSDADTNMISEAYHLWKTQADTVWPDWTNVNIPIMYITDEWDVAIGFNDSLKGFAQVNNDQLTANRTIQYRVRELDIQQAAAHDFQGVECVIIGTPETLEWSRTQWVLKTIHEMYHVMSAARGSVAKITSLEIVSADNAIDASWQLDYPFPYHDADVMRLMHLQGYPVYQAIITAPDSDEENINIKYNASTALEALEVLKSVLLTKTGDDRAYKYAKFQEGEEGVAKYTEYKIAELASSPNYVPLEDFTHLDGYTSYQELWDTAYKGMPFVIKHSGRAVKSRTLFYYMGAGKALLLDKIKPNWKENYFDQNVWLDDLIAQALI